MKKSIKLASLGLATVTCLATAFTAVGCGQKNSIVKDGKTLNISLFTAGYGVNWIYKMKEKFEAAYAEEGYKLNILAPRAGYAGTIIAQDIVAGSEVDVFFSQEFTEKVMAEYSNTPIVADLTNIVFNQKPIDFNGNEEGTSTVAEKLEKANTPYMSYQHDDGSYYAMPYQKGIRGLAVNKAVLAEYNLEIPKTSKEFFNCFDVIMSTAATTGIFPITHIGSSNNYASSFLNCWVAQYEGYDWYTQFTTFQNADGTNLTKDQAVEMFNADGIEYMLTNLYRALDPNCGTFGSATQSLEKAQAKLMNGSCAFMMNGDWLIQETYESFSDAQRNNMTFVNVPVISELGVKVFKDKYNKTEAECETILRAIIDEVDANKALADIKTAVDAKLAMNIDIADIETIAKARGMVYSETVHSGAVINANSSMKDIAALLLRMCASEGAAQIFADEMYSSSPFASSYTNNRYEFVNSSRAIMSNRYQQGIRPEATGYRATLHADFTNLFPRTGLYVNLEIIAEGITTYNAETLVKIASNDVYATAAKALQKTNHDAARDNYNSNW